MILGYSNDKDVYIYIYIYIYFNWLVDSPCKIRHVQPTGFDSYHHAVPSRGIAGKEGLTFSEGRGVQLSHNKLQSDLMTKKVYKQKYFSL